jgi:hypothetical protein
MKAAEVFGPGLSSAEVTDFAIGHQRRCSGEISADHPFRRRGACDRREDPTDQYDRTPH